MALQKQSLVTYRQVINRTPVSSTVPEEFLKNHMDLELIFESRMGSDFLEALLDDRAEYEVVNEFTEGHSYAINDIADYHGRFYEKISDDEQTVVTDPSCSTDWEVKNVFTTDCLNDLWDRLNSWLCWKVAYVAAPFIDSQYGPGGFTKQSQGNQKKAVNESQLASIMSSYGKRCGMIYGVLKKKIQAAYDTGECEVLEKVDFIALQCGSSGVDNVTNYDGGGMMFRHDWED